MIKNAIKSRIAKSIESLSFKSFMLSFDKFIIFAWVFVLMFYPDSVNRRIGDKRPVVFALFILSNAYAFFDIIVSEFYKVCQRIYNIRLQIEDYIPKTKTKDSGPVIDGIVRDKLIDFLLDHSWFPYVHAKDKLWLFPKEYKKLGDNLERVGVLVRWDNNARVLSEKVDRELLEKIISKTSSDDLTLPLLQEWSSLNFENV